MTPSSEPEIGTDLLETDALARADDTIILEQGWFRCVDGTKSEHYGPNLGVGDLVYLADAAYQKCALIYGEWQFDLPEDEFIARFVAEPNGARLRQEQLLALMADIDATAGQVQSEARAAASAAPALTDGGALGESALAVNARAVAESKRTVALLRNTAEKLTLSLERKSKHLEGFGREAALIAKARLKAVTRIADKATDAVWALNLYLGADEFIEPIRGGAPAPAEQPIVVRQRVLYMDEECAIGAERGGIDADRLDDFDAWLLADPANLDQVLPETRGLVALRPRHKTKKYPDPFQQMVMDERNQKTYLLVRNGERVYRFWTPYEAGARLIPGEREFDLEEIQEEYRDARGVKHHRPAKPGSGAWMEAMDRASTDKQHYMRFFLLLRGILERTPCFTPMRPIDLADPNEWGTRLIVLRDMDGTLGDGHERFGDWRKRVNAKIDVGHRVVGVWYADKALAQFDDADSKEERRRGHRYLARKNSRLVPATAEYPDTNVVYTVEGRTKGNLFFLYDRHYDGYGPDDTWGRHTMKTRARCTIAPEDAFWLDLDAADTASMRFFLSSRYDREQYEILVPLLRLALKAKADEDEREAPFRLLLIGRIAQAHNVTLADAEAAVSDLLLWWKTRSRIHRALADDNETDRQALAAIVAEFGRRRRETESYDHARTTATVDAVLAHNGRDALLLVGHREGSEYRALVAHNTQNVWVTEQTWRTTDGTPVLVEAKPWRLVDGRWRTWRLVYEGRRWAAWRRDLSASAVLSDPDRESLMAQGWSEVLAHHASDQADPPVWLAWVLATHRGREILQVFYRKPLRLHEKANSFCVGLHAVAWKRLAGGVQVDPEGSSDYYQRYSDYGYDPGHFDFERYEGRKLLRSNPAGLAQVEADYTAHQDAARVVAAASAHVRAVVHSVEAAFRAQDDAAHKQRFLDDYGDESLWKRWLEKNRTPYRFTGDLEGLVTYALAQAIPLDGRTVGDVLTDALAAGLTDVRAAKLEENKRTYWHHPDLTPLPSDPDLLALPFTDPGPPEDVKTPDEKRLAQDAYFEAHR